MQGSAKNVDEYLADLPEWQRDNLRLFRALIHEADSEIKEEIKWKVPAFVKDKKVLFTMASFKAHTKYNFILNGAFLDDKYKLFNNGLESNKSRSIDLAENDYIDRAKLKDLIAGAARYGA